MYVGIGFVVLMLMTGVSMTVDQVNSDSAFTGEFDYSDLRTLTYPNRDTLRAMSREMKTLDLSQREIDQLVTKHLHVCR